MNINLKIIIFFLREHFPQKRQKILANFEKKILGGPFLIETSLQIFFVDFNNTGQCYN